jgi:hypothetical protein
MDRTILHAIKRWKYNVIGHILRKNRLQKRINEGKVEKGI